MKKLKNFNEEIEIKKLKEMMKILLDSDSICCNKMARKDLPDIRGVYCFFNKKNEPVYIGSCGVEGKQKRTIRTRVWEKHMSSKSTLINKLKKFQKLKTKEEAIAYIKSNFSIRFIEIEDNSDRIITRLEHFMIAVYNPTYNDKYEDKPRKARNN